MNVDTSKIIIPVSLVRILTLDLAVRLWCAFTTASMAIAYASSYDPKPRVCPPVFTLFSCLTAHVQLETEGLDIETAEQRFSRQ